MTPADIVPPIVMGEPRGAVVQLGEVKRVRIELGRTGRDCKVFFDDVEQENVYSVQVGAEVNGLSSVVVGFFPTEGIVIEGEGQVVKLDRSNDLRQLVEQAFARGYDAGKAVPR